ncbi:sigma-70 family RNA polymerase sigma factor [Rhodoplanes sp.]|uniref:RNA polymerase sigma factor n=1 Tax=Rhodoplanes sp. TaxID=1968906 RepID=UPI0025F4E28C|nr:sigma-70 family RNA polymerase sigma factor [Rhodoplanes sp.]
MSDTVWTSLRQMIVLRYDTIRARLTRSLGSRELAEEVLQETYLRLQRSDAAGVVRQPESYIFRVALNLATDQRREERRRASRAEVLATLRHQDGPPDLSREMEARSDVEALKTVLAQMPSRRRAILIAARVDGMSHEAIAKRFNISRTMVQKELRQAVRHCAERLRKNDEPR